MQSARLEATSTAFIVRCIDARRRRRDSQREHLASVRIRRIRIARLYKSATLQLPEPKYRNCTGVRTMSNRFTQYILAAMVLGIVMGAAIFNFLPDSRAEIASERQPDRHAVPAPDQDDHRAFGIRYPGRRHRPYGHAARSSAASSPRRMGWFVSASFISLLLGLVMVNLLQPGANFPGTLPDKRRNRPACRSRPSRSKNSSPI